MVEPQLKPPRIRRVAFPVEAKVEEVACYLQLDSTEPDGEFEELPASEMQRVVMTLAPSSKVKIGNQTYLRVLPERTAEYLGPPALTYQS